MKRQFLIVFVKYGLGLGLLAAVVVSYWHNVQDGKELGLAGVFERRPHLPFLALAAVITVAGVLLTFVRWYILVRAQQLPFTLASALRLGMVGYYLSTFLPGAVGGDIIKAACIAREQSRRTVAITTVIMDRVIGLCGLIWLVALIGGFFWATGLLMNMATSPSAVAILVTIFVGAAALTVGSILFWGLLGWLPQGRAERLGKWLGGIPKLGAPLAELWRASWLYRCRGRCVAVALAMSMIGHLGFVLVFYFASRSVNEPESIPSLEAHFLIVPVGMTFAAGFPSPGGVGGGEFGYGELYRMLGFAVAAGVLASLMKRAIEWLIGLVGYLIYLRMKPGLVKMSAPARNTEESSLAAPREALGHLTHPS